MYITYISTQKRTDKHNKTHNIYIYTYYIPYIDYYIYICVCENPQKLKHVCIYLHPSLATCLLRPHSWKQRHLIASLLGGSKESLWKSGSPTIDEPFGCTQVSKHGGAGLKTWLKKLSAHIKVSIDHGDGTGKQLLKKVRQLRCVQPAQSGNNNFENGMFIH